MNTYREEKLPQVVEDRLQEAYDIIRKEERKKMNKKKFTDSDRQTGKTRETSHTMKKQPKTYRRWIGAAAGRRCPGRSHTVRRICGSILLSEKCTGRGRQRHLCIQSQL